MRWITRARPKVDRVACPWLVARFVDPTAEFVFVPAAEVAERAAELGAVPFDVEGVELSHVGPRCSFDGHEVFSQRQTASPSSRCSAV